MLIKATKPCSIYNKIKLKIDLKTLYSQFDYLTGAKQDVSFLLALVKNNSTQSYIQATTIDHSETSTHFLIVQLF